MLRRYNSFGSYIKKQFGTTVYKVNVDAGFTCPNRDGTIGTAGCIYCNNDSFRPNSCTPTLTLHEQIHNGIAHVRKRYKADRFLVYFQPYTNTYAPVHELEHLYRKALSEPSVVGLAIGTKLYRRLSEHNRPAISQVIKKRNELAAMDKDNRGAPKKNDGACDLCSGCVIR